MNDTPELSVVTTSYQSAKYIEEFCLKTLNSIKNYFNSYQLLIVDDGSTDDSVDILKRLADKDRNITLIVLSRNFGHHEALMTGLRYADGEYIYILDSDLEEDPNWISAFKDKLHSTNSDIVIGVQRARKGSLFEKISGKIFYKLFNFLSEVKLPADFVTSRLMTRKFLKGLLGYEERELYFAGLCALAGFKQEFLDVEKLHKGSTTYSISKRIRLAIRAITSFSNRPMYLIFLLGCFVTALSIGYSLYILYMNFRYNIEPGFSSIILSIWLLGGLIFISIGVVGLYLSRIFIEVKRRPLTIIEEIYKADGEKSR